MSVDTIERLAIRAAKGNNGGEWATHYTEEQKEFWREFVRDLIAEVKISEVQEKAEAFQHLRDSAYSIILRDKATGEVAHVVFYDRPPGQEDIDALIEELKTDEEFVGKYDNCSMHILSVEETQAIKNHLGIE